MAKKDNPKLPEDRAVDFLFKEVDEDVRSEQLRNWWQRFGSWLVGGAVAIVLATVAYELWQGHHHQQGEEATEAMLKAVELSEQDRAFDAAALLVSQEVSSDVKPLLMLQAAHYYAQAGAEDKEEALLNEIAESGSNPALQHYAKMRLGKEPDTSLDNPLYHTAREMRAIQLASEGKQDQARELLEKMVQNPTTPPTMVQRAEQLLRIYR